MRPNGSNAGCRARDREDEDLADLEDDTDAWDSSPLPRFGGIMNAKAPQISMKVTFLTRKRHFIISLGYRIASRFIYHHSLVLEFDNNRTKNVLIAEGGAPKTRQI